jgi:hypothetical protein
VQQVVVVVAHRITSMTQPFALVVMAPLAAVLHERLMDHLAPLEFPVKEITVGVPVTTAQP